MPECDICSAQDPAAEVPNVDTLADLLCLLGGQVCECAELVLCVCCSEFARQAARFVQNARHACVRFAILESEVKQEAAEDDFADPGEDYVQQHSSDEEVPLHQLKSEKERDAQDSKLEQTNARQHYINKRKKKKKHKKKIESEDGIKRETLDVEWCKSDKDRDTATDASKPRKEGRRVVETQQYIVIRLTPDQVRAEMADRAASERYLGSPFRCEQCVRGFNYREVLDTHMLKHDSKNGRYQCDLCHQYCPSEVSFRGHMKSHTTRYACKGCGTVKLSRQHLLEHHTLTHAGLGGYTCAECGYSCERRNMLQRHVRTHAPHKPLACTYCDKVFKTTETLKAHTLRHTNPGLYPCPVCPRRYPTPWELRVHKLTHTDVRAYTHYCVECDVRFASRSALSKHLRQALPHRSDTESCNVCNKTFSSRSSLQVHLAWAHEGRREYACTLCARTYGTRDGLRAHVRKAHAGGATVRKPTPCSYCRKMFKSRETLTKHLRTHTGERPYECAECGHKFAQSGTRATHIRLVHRKLSRRVRQNGTEQGVPAHAAAAITNQDIDKRVS